MRVKLIRKESRCCSNKICVSVALINWYKSADDTHRHCISSLVDYKWPLVKNPLVPV